MNKGSFSAGGAVLLKVRSVILVFFVIIACFVTETTILPSIAILDIMPNLMIIVTASYGFMFGDRVGILIGCVSGLLCDIFFGPLIGFQAAVYALIGYLCGKFEKILYVEDLAFPLTLIAAADLFYGFLSYVFLFMMQNRLFFRRFFLQQVIPEMVYTLLSAVLLYPLLRLLYQRFLRPVRRSAQSNDPDTVASASKGQEHG